MSRFVALLAFLVAAPLASAQSADTPLEEGARALVFGVNGFDLSPLDGGSLGLKWHRSEERAVRLGVTVAAQAQAVFGNDQNAQVLSASATLMPLRYRRSRTPIYLYTGIGPTGRVDFRRVAEGIRPSETSSMVGAGLAGVVGVEWIVAEAIGITGEYGQEVMLEGEFFGDERVRLSVRPRGVRLGLAVYF
ncbi:hypothetical protein [Rubrivirga sp. IMCC45206]|uniref:hypothetical protein n=1 Tax=Rubrivirga sp. IMCC45206 TaxID=3391614 RepID=UPI00398FC05F